MSWDPIWEKVFQEQDWGSYPETELVRFASRIFKDEKREKSAIKILDLGCGSGANSWYFAREGFSVYAIDGSPTAVEKTKRKFAKEGLTGNFLVADFLKIPFPDDFFDCVVDIGSIQHNAFENVHKIVSEIKRVLKPNGKFFGMMMFEDNSLSYWKGQLHFFKENELKELFRDFGELKLDYIQRTDNNQKYLHRTWEVFARK
ncbi:class I SAM-dependent methyltransferase [Candidatus Woesearchaeota archaeon]|nr:class I SAM-dependent methyltransferase [Candidatus Woesearchaeota archaeon]